MKVFKNLFFTVLTALMFVACNPTPAEENPKPAEEEPPSPNDIANLKALNQDSAVLLSWTENFYRVNIYGIEISYKQDTSSRNIYTEKLSYNTVIVPMNQKNCLINNLTNDITYLFTVKAIDSNGKKSTGVNISATPTKESPTEEEIPTLNDISNLSVLNQEAAVLLNWTENFNNQNIFGIEISYRKNTSDIYTEPLPYNTIIVPQNQKKLSY